MNRHQPDYLTHAAHLRALAAEWRRRATETTDPKYVTLMTRTADALEAQAAAVAPARTE